MYCLWFDKCLLFVQLCVVEFVVVFVVVFIENNRISTQIKNIAEH